MITTHIAVLTSETDQAIYNVGSPPSHSVSINELLQIICEKMEYSGPWINLPGRRNEVQNAVCDVSKIEKRFGQIQYTVLSSGVEYCIDFVRRAGARDFEHSISLEIVDDRVPNVWLGESRQC
jgi:nucleoside-diphosphate-sugar epimerase